MKNRNLLKYIVSILFILNAFIIGLFEYLQKNINVDFAAFLYTFARQKEGTPKEVIISATKYVTPYILISVIILAAFFITFDKRDITFNIKIKDKKKDRARNIDGLIILDVTFLLINIFVFLVTTINIDRTYYISEYFQRKNQQTTIYEDNYINPNNVVIEGKDTNNLILIYLESIETTFMSKDDGGGVGL